MCSVVLTPFPRITVGKISLLYWRQTLKAPLAVIRAMRATMMLTWGRIIEMLTKFLSKKFKPPGAAR